jgi:FkbM family methyltransferase
MLLDFSNLKQKYNMTVTGVIQAGAHYGEEFETVFVNEPTITKIALFEPDPDNFFILKTKINNFITNKIIHLNNCGLGPFACEMTLYKERVNGGQSNSVLKPKVHLDVYPHIIFDSEVKIKIEPLDKFEYIEGYDFLTIDVQGFELEVLRGARNTLKNIKWILLEVNREEGYENCALVEEIDTFLQKYNFKRVETSWWDDSFWGDAFYIKN